MKITAARAEAFARAPDPRAAAILVYGPDTGLVRERARRIASAVVEDLADPFRVAEISPQSLKAEPGRVADEAAALAFGGGRRVVWLRDATDMAVPAIEILLAGPEADALVLCEAGDLGPRSSLRRLFEGADNAAALPCYGDDSRSLESVIAETFRDRNVTLEADARAYLRDHLGTDRMVSRGELEKLALYAGEGGAVTLEDAVACIGDSAAFSIEDVIFAVADGAAADLDRAVERVFAEGASPVAVLRAMMRHIQRLQLAGARVRAGESAEAAMKSLRPPIFFKRQDRFRRQLTSWPPKMLARALARLTEAEIQCKTTGMPAALICSQALLALTAGIASRKRRAAA